MSSRCKTIAEQSKRHARVDDSCQQTRAKSLITEVIWPEASFYHRTTTAMGLVDPSSNHAKPYFSIQSENLPIPTPIREDENEDKHQPPVTITIGSYHEYSACSDVSSLSSWDTEDKDDCSSSWASNMSMLEEEEENDPILYLSSPPVSTFEIEELVLMDGDEMSRLFDEAKSELPTVVSVAQNPEESIGLIDRTTDAYNNYTDASLEDMDSYDSVPTISFEINDLNYIEQVDTEIASAVLIKDSCCKVSEDIESIFS